MDLPVCAKVSGIARGQIISCWEEIYGNMLFRRSKKTIARKSLNKTFAVVFTCVQSVFLLVHVINTHIMAPGNLPPQRRKVAVDGDETCFSWPFALWRDEFNDERKTLGRVKPLQSFEHCWCHFYDQYGYRQWKIWSICLFAIPVKFLCQVSAPKFSENSRARNTIDHCFCCLCC